jgi:hypothetical protein
MRGLPVAKIVPDGEDGEDDQGSGEWECGNKAKVFEADRSDDPTQEEESNEREQDAEFLGVGVDWMMERMFFEMFVWVGEFMVPVEELSELDAYVGDHSGDVGGADHGLGDFGDDGVLEPHGEAEEGDGGRDKEVVTGSQMAAYQTEEQQQGGFDKEGESVLAVELSAAAPVDQDGGAGCTEEEGEQGAESCEEKTDFAKGKVVSHGGDDAGHMGGVLMHGEEAARIGCTSDKGEEKGQMAISLRATVFSGESSQIHKRHSAYFIQ